VSTDIQRDELLRVVYTTPVLKVKLDESLEVGSKINAIKELRGWCETSDNPDWLKNRKRVSLRLMKDVVDKYFVRKTISDRLIKLQNKIELCCNKHGYDKMGSRRGAKSKDGLYVHNYTDYELVEDHIKFIVNDLHWYPSYSEYKEYNRMWKRYNAFK